MKRMGWLNRMRMSGAGTGDAAEFERLLRPHVPALYRSAYRWTGAVDRAEDLVQQLLVRLFPRLTELRALEQVRPWALRVMYRIFVDQVRRERSSPVQFGTEGPGDASDSDDEIERADDSADPIRLLEQQLTQERILAAWTQLTDEHRVVLSRPVRSLQLSRSPRHPHRCGAAPTPPADYLLACATRRPRFSSRT